MTPPHDAEPPLAQIGCSLAEAFAVTRCGHHVWLDDGKLGGVAEAVDQDSIELRITSAGAKGSKLRAGKGINLPDAVLDIDLLGFHSRDALQFAAEHADIVELSFVSRAHEVERVNRYLDQHSRPEVGMILKIETRRAFEHLPRVLLAALGGERPAGVMIARGDLAVECGYERLAEVQEEILWLCQAAHVPVILGHAGARSAGEDRPALTCRDHRCSNGRASRVRNAQQRPTNRRSDLSPRRHPSRMERHHRKKRSLLPRLQASDYVHTDRGTETLTIS